MKGSDCDQSWQDILVMEKFFNQFSADRTSFNYKALQELRWAERDKFTSLKETAEAQSNGITKEHWRNLTSLQDTLLAVFMLDNLWEMKASASPQSYNEYLLMLQNIFGETQVVLDFLYGGNDKEAAYPQATNEDIIEELVDKLPAMLGVLPILKRVFNTNTSAQHYHYLLLANLARKRPSEDIAELCYSALVLLEVLAELDWSMKNALKMIFEAFPYLKKVC